MVLVIEIRNVGEKCRYVVLCFVWFWGKEFSGLEVVLYYCLVVIRVLLYVSE